jgi:hypothetical protein
MKLKKILENIISEGASDILYHYIASDYILDMLQKNKINTIAAIGSDSDYKINKNKFYYLSTTRSKSSGFKKSDSKIVLDGRKLKQRYKITPVDYWNWPKSDKDNTSIYISSMQSLEQEDRIITNKPNIPNAKDYILGIHIYVGKKIYSTDKKIIDICEESNIPIFIYNNRQNFYNQIKPIDYTNYEYGNEFEGYEDDDSDIEKGREKLKAPFLNIGSYISLNDDNSYNEIIKYLDDDSKIEQFDNFFEDFKRNLKFKSDDIPYESKLLKNEVKTIQSDSGDDSRFILDLLRKSMRKNKVTNMEDYLKLKIYGVKSLKKLDDYKNDLYKFVRSEAMIEFTNQLDELQGWIQIDGTDYNNAYESDEIQEILYDYLYKLYDVIKEVVFDENRNVLRYSYSLDKTYLQQSFDYKNLNISDKLNITDIGHFSSTEEFDETIESVFYYVLMRIQRSSGDKADELYKEYSNNK